MTAPEVIRYASWRDAWASFDATVEELATPGASICDVGGGAQPQLSERQRAGRRYLVLDIDPEELDKCPPDVDRLLADVSSPEFEPPGQFDLVISRTVAEHVADPAAFHRNVRRLLKPGGVAVHFFPTLWALPFVCNRLLPEHLGERVLLRIQPNRVADGHESKFEALYRWCRGPTHGQIERLERVGYRVERYTGFFGHGYYWRLKVGGIRPLELLEDAKIRRLLRRPVPALTAYALVVMRRT